MAWGDARACRGPRGDETQEPAARFRVLEEAASPRLLQALPPPSRYPVSRVCHPPAFLPPALTRFPSRQQAQVVRAAAPLSREWGWRVQDPSLQTTTEALQPAPPTETHRVVP